MLGKLMKYEFMALGRIFLPLFAALIIMSLVSSLFGYLQLTIPTGLGIFVAVVLIIGIAVISFIITIQRFWTNLLSNEGYLTMTLPASVDSIILSKLFVSAILFIVSGIVVMGSILIMGGAWMGFGSILDMFIRAFENAPFNSYQMVIFLLQSLASVILGSFSFILLMYACMSLSMLVNKNRWLMAFGSYIAITTILQVVAVLIATIIAALGFHDRLDGVLNSFLMNFSLFGQFQFLSWSVVGVTLVLCVVYYLITRHMLSKRLNLQ
ncbi:MAG: hypothetical protein FWB75_00410 [Oscillospiraceae bacterium]|nr:hypothetical protein [Oscillospiraceae bacterium]